MVQVPQDQVTVNDLTVWFTMQEELKKLKASEMMLRKRIFGHYFPDPKEGTNTSVLPDTYQLKGVHVINRKIIEESMQALCYRPQLAEGVYGKSKLEEAGVRVDQLVKWKPELAISVYRELTEEQRHLVDQMLLIDAGSPQLKIEPPKAPRGGKKSAVDEVQDNPGAKLA